MTNAFAKLDSISGPDRMDGPQPEPSRREPEKPAAQPAATPEPTKDTKPPVADDEIPAEVPEKPAEAKPAEKPPEAAKPADAKPPEKPADGKPPSGWAKFREAEKQLAVLTTERDALRKEVADIRANPNVIREHPEFKAIATKAEAYEKQIAELQDHMRFVDYTKSQEYVEQYQKPYEEAFQRAAKDAMDLRVTSEDGTKRNVTEAEFLNILRMPNNGDAIEAAEALFGEGSPKAANILERRNQVISAYEKMTAAQQKYQKEGAERFKAEQAKHQQQQRFLQEQSIAQANKFREMVANGEKLEKMKDVFVAADGDAEGATMLQQHRHEADRAFAGGAPLAEGETPWTPQELLAKHAVMRNRAGAFPYTVRQLRKATARIAELEKQVAQYKGSEPGAGTVATGEAPPESGNALQRALKKLDSMQ